MTGLDSAIASLLASRVDFLLSSINPSANGTTAQANKFGLAIDTPANAAAQTAGGTPLATGPSAQTALSAVARTLDAISRFGGGATPPLLGTAPLWATAPRGLSAFASLSGSLFDSTLLSPATALLGVDQPAPPLPAAALALALAKTVDESGLFYESHLVQWAAGQRPTAALADEPQARIDSDAEQLPFEFATRIAADDPHAGAANTAPDMPADARAAVRSIALPQTPQQAAALAASVGDVPASVFSAPSHAASTPQVSAQDSAVQASIAAGINPATIPLVRQQLDLLATERFRWSGEAWPGARFDWEIAPQERDSHAPDPASGDDRAWRTRVTLSLPTLGTVDADLVLTGPHLVARIKASASGAARLLADGETFRQQLDIAGIRLQGLTIRQMDGANTEFDVTQSAATQVQAPKPVPSPLAHLFAPRVDGAGS
jgi:hypothetical protein